MNGTSQKAVRVFTNSGQISEIDLALGRAERPPTQQELNRLIAEPSIRDAVVAALRSSPSFASEIISSDKFLERELQFLALASQLTAEFPAVPEAEVLKAITKKQKITEELSVWDYFQPEGLTIVQGLAFFKAADFKLYHEFGQEWWRKEKAIEFLPTQAGIMTCDFRRIGTFFDLELHPFNLDYKEQISWAKEQGGDTIYSVEEALYRNFRGYQMLGYPVGFNGSERCRNISGSVCSLSLGWGGGDGLCVYGWGLGGRFWRSGAFPRKFLAL